MGGRFGVPNADRRLHPSLTDTDSADRGIIAFDGPGVGHKQTGSLTR